MAQLTVRGVPDEVAAALEAHAARAGRSAEAEHRRILEEALRSREGTDFFEAARAARQAAPRQPQHNRAPAAGPRPRRDARGVSPAEAPDAALVVDASVALHWVVEEARSEAALALKGRELAHPSGDCVYLGLVERMGRRVVTTDGRLLRAVRATEHAARVAALDGNP